MLGRCSGPMSVAFLMCVYSFFISDTFKYNGFETYQRSVEKYLE